ncbi:hypothetical protein [Bradyrhizobium japonicum]|nr:hypothetical protein [Bradyrhizobium japonicum]
MTIERPFPPRAESVDSFSPVATVGQRETGKRAGDSPRPITSQSNVLTFPGNRPASNVRAVDFPVTSRQRASRKRNLLRHPCNEVSLAVTIAGKLQRGEALRIDPYLDERAILWKGIEAARLLLAELFDLSVKQAGSVDR